jgi:uncharacterized protein (TIGR03083 family)
MESIERRLEVVQAEGERLAQYLASLAPEAWTRDSSCDRWEVRDVVAHLAGGADFYHDSVTRGLQGDSSPATGRPQPGTGDPVQSNEGIARGAVTLRESLGEQVLTQFRERSARLNHLFGEVASDQWDTTCYHPASFFPISRFIDLRISELAMHSHDIRSALEPEAHLSPDTLPTFMDLGPQVALRWGFRPSAKLPKPLRFRFNVSGAELEYTDIVVSGDDCRGELPGEDEPDVTFQCSAETLALVLYGRANTAAALASGALKYEGDAALAQQFAQWFGVQ